MNDSITHNQGFIQIHIMSFTDATIYSCLQDIPPTIIISIDDPGFSQTPFDIDNNNIIGVLKLKFCDEDEDKKFAGMTADDADQVVSFVKHYLPLKPEIMIHCAAGRSRSAGVAAALNRWLNGTDKPVMDSPYRTPNFLCYKRVCTAAGVQDFDEEVERERFRIHHEQYAQWSEQGYDYTLCSLDNSLNSGVNFFDEKEFEENKQGWNNNIDYFSKYKRLKIEPVVE